MSGPTGFVTRVKGKVSYGAQDPIQHRVEYVAATVGGSTNSLYPSGFSIISCSTAAAYFQLGAPEVGTEKVIVVTTMASAITIKTNSTAAGGVYFDSTTQTMIHPSTSVTKIQLFKFVAASSVLWMTIGGLPSTASTMFGTAS